MNLRKLKVAAQLLERIAEEKINLKERMRNHELNKLDGAPEMDDLHEQTQLTNKKSSEAPTHRPPKGRGIAVYKDDVFWDTFWNNYLANTAIKSSLSWHNHKWEFKPNE